MVARAFNPGPWEAEANESMGVEDQPGLHKQVPGHSGLHRENYEICAQISQQCFYFLHGSW